MFEIPLSTTEVEAAISSWLAQPAAGILDPGERHWEILCGLMRNGQATGPLVMDAVLAAIALEHGATGLHDGSRLLAVCRAQMDKPPRGEPLTKGETLLRGRRALGIDPSAVSRVVLCFTRPTNLL